MTDFNEEISRYMDSEGWVILHDHTETPADGKPFRMVVLQTVIADPDPDNPYLRRYGQIVIRATPFWSEPIRLMLEYPPDSAHPDISVNWSSGGTEIGFTDREIARAMVAMWSWVHTFMEIHAAIGRGVK